MKESKALLNMGLNDGAYYLAGYAAECALKACIAKSTQRYEFPDKKRVESSHSHNLRELVRIADLEQSRLERANLSAEFKGNWDLVQSWSEQSRYRRQNAESAQTLLSALMDQRNGVMKWIKLRYCVKI